jgi:hypothetical protein
MSKYNEITLKLLEDKYKMLFSLKKREREKVQQQIFDTGYNIFFPSTGKELSEHQEIVAIVESLRNEFNNPEIGEKIDSLETSLGKLIGLSSNSSKKGEIAENILEEIIKNRYGDIQYKDMSHVPHSGDGWLTFSDNKIVMLESKNYNINISKEEVDKMERDMKEHNIKWGLFVSWNSGVVGRREFDIHVFNHQGSTYTIVLISNLSKDNTRLDLGIQVINNLRKRFNNIQKFPWIVSDISEDLNELNEIANMNYILRDSFQQVENNIRSTLSNFYNTLREYDYKIVKKSREILSKIESTMDESIINNLDTYDNILDQFEGKKMFNVLSQIFDNIKKFGWNIKQENGEIRIVKINPTKEDEDIGKIKVFCKKVTLFIEKLNISFEFKDINDSNFNSSFAVLKNTADIII